MAHGDDLTPALIHQLCFGPSIFSSFCLFVCFSVLLEFIHLLIKITAQFWAFFILMVTLNNFFDVLFGILLVVVICKNYRLS